MPVRPAIEADVPAVLPMVRAICAMHEQLDPARYPMLPDVVERYERWLPVRAADPQSVFLVATDTPDDHVVGFLVATIEANIPIYRLPRFGFIHDVWLEPTHRAKGLGRELVHAALRRFAALGVQQVRLETAAANESARRLFASCGFRPGTVDMLMELSSPPPPGA